MSVSGFGLGKRDDDVGHAPGVSWRTFLCGVCTRELLLFLGARDFLFVFLRGFDGSGARNDHVSTPGSAQGVGCPRVVYERRYLRTAHS